MPTHGAHAAAVSYWLAFLVSCGPVARIELPELDIDVPKEWSGPGEGAGAAGSLEDAWWESFADERLNKLVAESLRGNRNLEAAAERIALAEASAVMAGAELLPRLNTGANASRRKQIFVGLPIPGLSGPLSTRSNSYGVSLDLSWELDLWGRVRAGKSAAAAEHVAAGYDYLAAALSVAAQTCKAFFALTEAQQQIGVARERLANQKATTELIAARYAKGISPALDLKLARQELARSKARLAIRERLAEQARRQCELVLGRYPSARIKASLALPRLPPLPARGLPSELLLRRPDLLAGKQRLMAQGFRVEEAQASLLPRISMSASAGTQSNKLSDLLDGDFGIWSLLGNIVQPIFQGGRLRANVAVKEARMREALAGYANRCLVAFGEVENSLSAERWLAEQEKSALEIVQEAQAAARLARESYIKGSGGILELLISERSVFEAQSGLVEIKRSRLTTRIDLNLALGGGFASGKTPKEVQASGDR